MAYKIGEDMMGRKGWRRLEEVAGDGGINDEAKFGANGESGKGCCFSVSGGCLIDAERDLKDGGKVLIGAAAGRSNVDTEVGNVDWDVAIDDDLALFRGPESCEETDVFAFDFRLFLRKEADQTKPHMAVVGLSQDFR